MKKKKTSQDEKKPIPLDSQTYLTDEGSGTYMVWDQRDYPESIPIAKIDETTAKTIINNTSKGKKLLKSLYAQYEQRLNDQFFARRPQN